MIFFYNIILLKFFSCQIWSSFFWLFFFTLEFFLNLFYFISSFNIKLVKTSFLMEIGSRISRVAIFRHWSRFMMFIRVCLISFFFLLSSCFLNLKLQHLFNWRLSSIIFIYLFYIIFHWFWKWLRLSLDSFYLLFYVEFTLICF
jgi:hypothetical protein